MKKIYTSIITIVLLPALVCGCSTMFGRQSEEENVSFDANVQGVRVNCSGKSVETPGSIPLRQSRNHSCTAQMTGYEKKVFSIKSGVSGEGFGNSTAINTALWGWWTLGIGTVLGWLVDSVSGAMRNLKEESIYLEMKPLGTTPASERFFEKTVGVGRAVINTPVDVVKNTTSTALDTALSGGAQKMGVVEEETENQPSQAEEAKLKKSVKVI